VHPNTQSVNFDVLSIKAAK